MNGATLKINTSAVTAADVAGCTTLEGCDYFLSKLFGRSWFMRINLSDYSFDHIQKCTLGQLACLWNPDSNCYHFLGNLELELGDFLVGINETMFGIGFVNDIPEEKIREEMKDDLRANIVRLNVVWVNYIKQRQEEALKYLDAFAV